jgi:hypothetical protein
VDGTADADHGGQLTAVRMDLSAVAIEGGVSVPERDSHGKPHFDDPLGANLDSERRPQI